MAIKAAGDKVGAGTRVAVAVEPAHEMIGVVIEGAHAGGGDVEHMAELGRGKRGSAAYLDGSLDQDEAGAPPGGNSQEVDR